MSDKITAPFTAEQVLSLNGFQTAGIMHPFTCGEDGCRSVLVAVEWGWVCPKLGCEYTQDWAHSFMADGSWKKIALTFGLQEPLPYSGPDNAEVLRRCQIYMSFSPVQTKALLSLFKARDLHTLAYFGPRSKAQWARELTSLCRATFEQRNEAVQLIAGAGDPKTFRYRHSLLAQAVISSSATLLAYAEHLIAHQCRICGCTQESACPGGCSWVEPGLCSNPECVAKDKEATHALRS